MSANALQRGTAGPWHVGDDGHTVYGPRGERVADTDFYNKPTAVSVADARHVALLPEMLDALRAFCGDYEATRHQAVELKTAYEYALAVLKRIDEAP